ncbi:MAG: tRNA (guanosine(46)-N7)-methyltransferase TrmB [Pseudomonadota bacterium]
MADETTGRRRNLYGRRRSHRLRPGQQHLMDELLPSVSVLRDLAPNEPVDVAALFDAVDDFWLEIGFGGGEHLADLAQAHPQIGFIGCEHYIDGVAKMMATIEREELENVRIHPHDARDVLDRLPDGSVGRIYLLYPDPWPKTRHHKRRFVSAENLSAFARVLREGGELRIASDIPDYIRHTLVEMQAQPAFEWLAECRRDWVEPWEGWKSTRYEEKALREGRRPCYLRFARR